MQSQLSRVKTGNPEEQDTLVNAVIHRASFNRSASYIEFAKTAPNHKILHGGKYDDSVGYFVHPTVIQTTDPNSKLLREEIFGPIFTLYVYVRALLIPFSVFCL
jgi:1-pyrroline-5-carboxylate dehydrogenase